jgi:hypothetical protein
MSKQAAKHHNKAAEHQEHAAEAAKAHIEHYGKAKPAHA